MDGLALLCALHADGPQSLRRLRRSGCPSLESVADLEVDRLAELLASTPTAAQRFQREAHHLLARLGSSATVRGESALLEVEDAGALDAPLLGNARNETARNENARNENARNENARHESATAEVSASREELLTAAPGTQAAQKAYDAVLARWRALDALEDARAVAEPIVEESSAPAPHVSPRTPLSVLQDLADESRDAMTAVGIIDLEGLAACDALELSRASGLDYSNAVRWRSLARRALPTGPERFSHSGRPEMKRAPIVALDEFILRPQSRPEDASRRGSDPAIAAREETAGGPFA
jgi:hypothetical protein